MNKKVISDFQKMIDVNTPIIYINDYDFVRIDEIIVEIVGNSKVFEWNPATGTTIGTVRYKGAMDSPRRFPFASGHTYASFSNKIFSFIGEAEMAVAIPLTFD